MRERGVVIAGRGDEQHAGVTRRLDCRLERGAAPRPAPRRVDDLRAIRDRVRDRLDGLRFGGVAGDGIGLHEEPDPHDPGVKGHADHPDAVGRRPR